MCLAPLSAHESPKAKSPGSSIEPSFQMPYSRPALLPAVPDTPTEILNQVKLDHDRFAAEGLPDDLDRYLREVYGLDMTSSYAGLPLRNPWGKASGQLSLNRAQIEEAAEARLGRLFDL